MSRKFWLRLVLCLAGIPLVVLVAAWLLASQYVRTQEFSDRVADLLSSVAGRECRIHGMIRIGLLPEPHIEVRGVSMAQPAAFAGQPAFLEVESLGVYLAWATLREGLLAVDEFQVDQARILLLYDTNGRTGWQDLPDRILLKEPDPPAPDTPAGLFPGLSPSLTFTLENTDILLRNVDSGATVQLADLDMRLRSGASEPARLLVESPSLKWSGVDCGLLLNADILVEGGLSMSGTLAMSGNATLNASDIPFELRLPFALRPDMSVDIADALVRVEGDAVRVSGILMGLPEGEPRLKGTAIVEHVSLPRWFPFGRRLPSGLQHALNNIRGSLDFTADTRGVHAPRVDAVIAGMPLQGTLAVPDFRAPAIIVDAQAEAVDINKILPEIVESGVKDPLYAGPVVIDEGEGGENIPDVGYDVRIRTRAAHVWRFDLADFSFRCSPSAGGTVLDFASGSAYGGTLTAAVDIIDEGYHTTIHARDMLVDEPAGILAGYNAATGRLNAQFDAIGDGRLLPEILATLAGRLEGTLTNGSVRFGDQPENPVRRFGRFDISGRAKGAGLPATGEIPQRLDWTGDWKAAMRDMAVGANWEFNGSGTLHFDTDIGLPVAGRRLSGTLSAQLDPALTGLDTLLPVQAGGLFSLDAEAGTFALEQGFISLPGLIAEADFTGSGLQSTIQAEGWLSAGRLSPRELLPQLDIPLWDPEDPTVLDSASLDSRVVVNGADAAFEDMRLAWAGSLITGRAGRLQKARPFWELDLHADSMDLDRWLQKKPEPGAEPALWPLDWLGRIDAAGTIAADSLEFQQMLLEEVSIPLRLREGEFVADAMRAAIAGGRSISTLRFTVNDGLLLNLVSEFTGVDLGLASLKAAGGAYVGGTASGRFDLAGTLHSGADIPAAISGAWTMQLVNGFYSTAPNATDAADPTIPAPGRTSFENATASGILQNGVVHNDDLHVSGRNTEMLGSGWVDLVLKTLDYYVEVTIAGVPTVPVYLTGRLHAPTSRVQAGHMVVRTLGNIGSGVFGIIGGIFSLPLRALEAMQDPNMPPPDIRDLDSLASDDDSM